MRAPGDVLVAKYRRLALLLVPAALAAGAMVWALGSRPEHGPRGKPGSVAAEIAVLERALTEAPRGQLSRALYAVRALGPKAPASARELVLSALAKPGELGAVPEWVGSEPRRALGAMVLESRGESARLTPDTVPDPVPANPATDPFTLYWQVEYAALWRREEAALVPTEQLANLCNAALRVLERGPLDSLGSAWLAAATFRAVPKTPDTELEARTRRLYAKLVIQSRSPGASVELAGARLEALSSYALWQLAERGQLDPKTRAVLHELQHGLRLALGSEPRGDAATTAALRALRLSKAVLGDTDGVFPQ